jgi:UDP-N-acetyl-2-amino-2-deoxyglucuronate dehydrogenase
MAAAAASANRVLALGQTMRHAAPIRWLQDHLHDFGSVRAVEVSMCVRWDGPQAPWWKTRTPDQGLILSLFAPHALDFVQLVFDGNQPLHVHAEVARFQQDWLGEDEAMVLLRYPGGRLAQVHLSYNQRFFVDRRTVHFENAMLRIANGERLWVDDRLIVEPASSEADGPRLGDEHGGVFRIQFEEFVRGVRGEAHRCVLPPEGVQLTRLLQRTIDSGLANSAQA